MAKTEDILELSVDDVSRALDKKLFSSSELTQAYIDAMSESGELNIYVDQTPELALEMAGSSDSRRSKGEVLGHMDGIPIAVKDLFCTKGVSSTAGSHILDGFKPTYESTVTKKLWESGAILLGKTNMDEFAMGSANVTSYYGPCINPWKAESGDNLGKDLVPGGSSGGSAAAVAARVALAAIGTDTGGSIRQPSSFCGIVGLKPTYGRCSRWGIISFASSLDQAGPLTRSVKDAALMLEVMAGYDPKDSTSADFEVTSYSEALSGKVEGLKIGIPAEYTLDGMPDEINSLWERGKRWLEDSGANIIDISLPQTNYALPAYYIIAHAEASSNLARYDGVRYGLRVEGEDLIDTYEKTRAQGFGAEVKRRIMIGTYVLSAGYYDAYYIQAQKVRSKIINDFDNAWSECDVILTPTAPSAAFSIGEKMDDPISMYMNDVFTVPASMAGLPAISVPAGLSNDGLPLGLHLIGPKFAEEKLLLVAKALELAADFSFRPKT